MNKLIVSKVSKLDTEATNQKYGETVDLAVVLQNEGNKISIITPRTQANSAGSASLAISKKDLKELLKMVKDYEDDIYLELDFMFVGE